MSSCLYRQYLGGSGRQEKAHFDRDLPSHGYSASFRISVSLKKAEEDAYRLELQLMYVNEKRIGI